MRETPAEDPMEDPMEEGNDGAIGSATRFTSGGPSHPVDPSSGRAR